MIVLITLVLFLCPNANVAHAATYANGERLDWNRKMTEGRSIYYWLAPGNDYTVSIPQAAQKLMYPGYDQYNPMNLTQTSVQQQAKIEFYRNNNPNLTYTASASSWRKNSSGNYYQMPISEKDTYDWVYATIQIVEVNMAPLSSDLKRTILIHEMLHAYGLRDLSQSNNVNKIMYRYWNHWTNYVILAGVTPESNAILNEKY